MGEWTKNHNSIFLAPLGNEGQYVADIFAIEHFRMLIGSRQGHKGSPVADPFLIAAARACNGCVVTEEKLKPNAAKIPNVCDYFGVQWTNIEGFLERENWIF